jgi:hypothetical protein
MITNHDIEIAFVRAQNRINERLSLAQYQFLEPDMERFAETMTAQLRQGTPEQINTNNPIANEEI